MKDFELSKIELPTQQSYENQCETIEIVLCINGKVTLTEGENQLTLEKGKSVLLTSGAHYKITSESDAQLFKASVPH